MSRLGDIIGKLNAATLQSRAASAGVGAAVGAVLGPVASTFTGDGRNEKETTVRDMIAGALGGAIGGLLGPGVGTAGGAFGGLLAGLADKTASQAGQDLRLPAMGGTKFPTDDSKGVAAQQLKRSMAEVGPMMPLGQGPSLDDVVAAPKPRMKWASIGDSMDPLLTDPLMLYLKKEAAEAKEPPPLTGLVGDNGQLKDNESFMPLGKAIEELVSQAPEPT